MYCICKLRLMLDVEGPLSQFIISLIGGVHIGARVLLDIHVQYNFFVFFLAGYSALATHLLILPILYFRVMSGFEPRELPQQAGTPPTQPPIFTLSHPTPRLATHLYTSNPAQQPGTPLTQPPIFTLSHPSSHLATHLLAQPSHSPHRHRHIIDMVWLYRLPISVGRKGVF